VLIIDIFGTGIDFNYGDTENALTLGDVLIAVLPDFSVKDLNLPPGLPDIMKLQMTKFSVIRNPKSLKVELRVGDRYDIIRGHVSILDPTMFIEMTSSKPRKSKLLSLGHGK
jgi:hypothetical protein